MKKILPSPDKCDNGSVTSEAGRAGWKNGTEAALRCRGNANNTACSGRNLNANNGVGNANWNNGGSAQEGFFNS